MFASIPLEYYIGSTFFNAIAFTGIVLVLLCMKPQLKSAKWFLAFSVLPAVWAWFYYFWLSSDDPITAGFLERTCMFPVAWFSPVFVSFACALTNRRIPKTLHMLNYGLSVLICLTIYTPLFATGVGPYLSIPYWLIPGPIFPIHMAHTMGGMGFGFVLVWTTIKHGEGSFKQQLLWVFWAYLIGFSAGCTNYLAWYRVPFPPIFNPLSALAAIGVAYAMLRHGFLDIRVVIKKSLVYSLLVACITAIYLVAIMIMEKVFQGVVGYESLPVTVIVAFLIALVFNPLRTRIQSIVDRALFRATPTELADQRERLLEEVQKTDQMRAVGTLAAGLAHEIKNPLTPIKTFTEDLEKRYEDPEFRKKFKHIVGTEVERINHIVQRLMDFAKPVKPEFSEISAVALMDETVELLNNEMLDNRVKLLRKYERVPKVHGDQRQIKQVFLNLLLNSLDAMKPKGGELRLSIIQLNDNVLVRVADTGPGIPKKNLGRVFDPFFTSKERGTGLGLSVVHSIVTEHRGQISISSELGSGATVEIKLPIAANQCSENERPPEPLESVSLA